jgi:hypothetical protein
MVGMVLIGSERQGRPKSVPPGNREWITVIWAIAAESQSIAPLSFVQANIILLTGTENATFLTISLSQRAKNS